MPGLTAKVFRTYNASWTFQEQLEHTPKNGTVQEKIAAYNKANKDVAILCNHQKTVSKTHAASMEKLGDKVCTSHQSEKSSSAYPIYVASRNEVPANAIAISVVQPRRQTEKETP